jgi:hypothetical protein
MTFLRCHIVTAYRNLRTSKKQEENKKREIERSLRKRTGYRKPFYSQRHDIVRILLFFLS